MALGLQPPPPENWERWPQHHPTSADYSMMGPGMVPYEPRPGTTAPLQRSTLAPHFVAGPAFNLNPMTPATSPGTYHGPVSYGGYVPYGPSPTLDAPFKSQHCLERAQPTFMHTEPGFQRHKDGWRSAERSPSPSIKSETQMSTSANSTTSDSSATSTASKNIIPNVRVNGAPVHEFHTPVDKLMRTIQAIMAEDDSTDKTEPPQRSHAREVKAKRRRFCCDIPGCSKTFAQKNNLDTHRRAHTGECPYVCNYCGERFTQGVNLKSHIFRHTGEKPYECTQCGKAFPQKGNLTQHMKTHDRTESWVCKLDGCNKTFTTRGNLKPHQNKFHQHTIDAFFAKFATITDASSLSEEDKEMAKYLRDLYPYANMGIKGRGKGRKVKLLVLPGPKPQQQQQQQQQKQQQQQQQQQEPAVNPASNSAVHPPYAMPLPHGLPHVQLHTPQPTHHAQPFHGLSNPAAYSITRPNLLGVGPRGAQLGYGMMGSDDGGVANSSGQVSAPGLHLYEDQGRDLTFSDRMY
ncbi:DNA-binding transcription factor [Madurella fahalii]|uniref:C2H2 type master regulator of conidiophore development brlA n=1 Tax=Madurella fahalii TaxID=1157608 RepID=A0ABQ0GBG1_9PEZI